MKAAVLTLSVLIVAAALAQPALASRSDYIWLANTVQQTSVQPTSGAGPMAKAEARAAVNPRGDYFFLLGPQQPASAPQASVNQAPKGCQCVQHGAGAGPKAQPPKARSQTATAQPGIPFNY